MIAAKIVLSLVALLALLIGAAIAAGATFLRRDQIAFASYYDINPDIFLIDVGSGLLHNLTRSRAYDVTPAWSPDGNWIAFASDRDGRRSIYVMDRFGGRLRRLTNDNRAYTLPRWSADGERLVFTAMRAPPGTFYSINFDGTGLQLISDLGDPAAGITLDIAYDAGSASRARAPDGSRIAFLTYRDQGWGIYLSRDQSLRDAYLLASVGYFTEAPVWSPDSQQMAFIALNDGTNDLYVVDVEGGSAPRRLTWNHAIDTSPAWNP